MATVVIPMGYLQPRKLTLLHPNRVKTRAGIQGGNQGGNSYAKHTQNKLTNLKPNTLE